jgi:hypothetical protein
MLQTFQFQKQIAAQIARQHWSFKHWRADDLPVQPDGCVSDLIGCYRHNVILLMAIPILSCISTHCEIDHCHLLACRYYDLH